MKNKAKFWNKIAKKYAKQPIADMQSYEHKLDKTREYFTPDSNVIEMGCGTGSTAILHAPFVNKITGIDISDEMLAIAQQRLAETSLNNVEFTNADIETLTLNEPADVVMAMSLLHLLEDKEAVLNSIYNSLKPNAVLVTSTACIADKMNYFRFIGPILHFFNLIPRVKIFSTEQLKKSMSNAGFNIEYCWQPEKGMSTFIIAKKKN